MVAGFRRGREGHRDSIWWQYWLNLELQCDLGLPCKVVPLQVHVCKSKRIFGPKSRNLVCFSCSTLNIL